MNDDQDTFWIKNYLLGNQPEEEKQKVERRISTDPTFAEDFRFQRALFAALEQKEMEALKRMLQQEELTYRKPPENKWWWAILLLVLLVGAAYWFLKSSTADVPAQAPPPNNKPADAPVPDTRNQNLPVQTPKPMADASRFMPNPAWEAQINSGLRGAINDSLALKSPLPAAEWPAQTTNRVNFKGIWYAESPENELLLSVFNNRDAQPLITQKITTILQGDRRTFEENIRIKHGPGLYYYSLEAVNDGHILKTGKFFLR